MPTDLETELRDRLGPAAAWHLYDRSGPAAVNLTLEVATRLAGSSLAVYEADGGVPEIAGVAGFSHPVILFHPRVIGWWADMRFLLTTGFYGGAMLTELWGRLFLQIMAEYSVWRRDDTDLALAAICRAGALQPGLYHLPNTLTNLAAEPLTAGGIMCQGFALAHAAGQCVEGGGGWPDHRLRQEAEEVLAAFPMVDFAREEALSRLRADEAGFVFSPSVLRPDAVADSFATAAMMETTQRLLMQAGTWEHPNSLHTVIPEIFISVQILTFLRRCARLTALARLAPQSSVPRDIEMDSHYQPALLEIRTRLVRQYLEMACLRFVHGEQPTDENRAAVAATMDAIRAGLQPSLEAMEKGYAYAGFHLVMHHNRPDMLAEELTNWQGERNARMLAGFVELAERTGFRSPHSAALAEKVRSF